MMVTAFSYAQKEARMDRLERIRVLAETALRNRTTVHPQTILNILERRKC